MGAPQDLPSFPCWCKATYSWGGETKKDLGFVEGDLIEALNAGDGSWWMGRLRRDPRAIGLFPSNFVKVLDNSFQPAPNSRNPSPITTLSKQQKPQAKNALFRKPYQTYGDSKRSSLENGSTREGTPEAEKKSKFRPYASMKTAQAPTGTIKIDSSGRAMPKKEESEFRIPAPPPRSRSRSPMPPLVASPLSRAPTQTAIATPVDSIYRAASPQPGHQQYRSSAPSRPHSPLPSTYHDGSAFPQILPSSRQPSPNLYQQQQYPAAPPQPQQFYDQHISRAPSPRPFEDDLQSSPPPPPPPAHRTAYQPSRAPSPQPYTALPHGYYHDGARTPVPPSPGVEGHQMTPSPLRDAMNDVMSSLQDMSVLQKQGVQLRNDPPSTIWSPDEFELVRSRSQQQRAQSSLGFSRPPMYGERSGTSSGTPSLPPSRDGPSQLDDFVERMEHQLRHTRSTTSYGSDNPPAPPLKGAQYSSSRPTTSSSHSSQESHNAYRMHSVHQHPNLRSRKSAYELGRSYTTKTNFTNSTESSSATASSNSTQLTSRSIMSGYSASGFSATSAGSLARRKFGLGSQKSQRGITKLENKSTPDIGSSVRSTVMSESSGSGPSYHESHASENQPITTPTADWTGDPMENAGIFGGLGTPKNKKSSFFKKMIDSAKSTARTGAASARSTIGSRPGSRSGPSSPTKSITGFAGGLASRPGSSAGTATKDMGLGAGVDWMQVRRDVNRSNSLSRREREDRAERCEMLDFPVLDPIEQLHQIAEGDEGLDGLPIAEPTDFNTPNLALVDKSTRFLQSLPPMISPGALAQSYVCRPHRSDVQRARAIFTWVAERISWDEDFEGQVDARRVIQTKRGCSEEIAVLVRDMCHAVGLQAEIIRGYLKTPGEVLDLEIVARPNHWWNSVIVDGEWRILDCSLAAPTHPKRSAYSSANSQVAESFYFLTRPMEACYTHIPLLPEQQHIVPPAPHEVLIALPCACPSAFRNSVELSDFNTSMLHLENLEMSHLHVNVPEDVECIAETEARGFAQDMDGDYFESGDIVRQNALAQPDWICGRKRYTIKALLPGDSGQGVLKIYAGKRGLMHSVKDNPHSLALALPLSHTGQNPPYDFLTRHPTPHAQRHDLYVSQPQCARLVMNNTFVFCIRQHPSSLSRFTPDTWGSGSGAASANTGGSQHPRPTSPNPYVRPTSAMSMVSASMSMSGSAYSDNSAPSNAGGGMGMTVAQLKPAKLAIQSPSQKIIRLTRKQEHTMRAGEEEQGLATSWETVIKVGERGTWRALVLADRSARWCVFAEWECV